MRCLIALLSLFAVCAHAQDKPTQLPPVQPGYTVLEEPPELPGIEPKIEHVVTEDDNARVDVLRVRGTVLRIMVHPKLIPAPDYEILVGDASTGAKFGHSAFQGVIGNRVWHVLDF
ncbi:MAG TPA: hypothetical protein VGM81_23040 [Burkholderiaceae bacterium]